MAFKCYALCAILLMLFFFCCCFFFGCGFFLFVCGVLHFLLLFVLFVFVVCLFEYFRCHCLPRNKQQKGFHSSSKEHQLCELESRPTAVALRSAIGFNRTRTKSGKHPSSSSSWQPGHHVNTTMWLTIQLTSVCRLNMCSVMFTYIFLICFYVNLIQPAS